MWRASDAIKVLSVNGKKNWGFTRGIGPEIVAEAIKVLNCLNMDFGPVFEYGLIGGMAYDVSETPFPQDMIDLIKNADADRIHRLAAIGVAGCERQRHVRTGSRFGSRFRGAKIDNLQATVSSAAVRLHHTYNEGDATDRIERAFNDAVDFKVRTADIYSEGMQKNKHLRNGDAVVSALTKGYYNDKAL